MRHAVVECRSERYLRVDGKPPPPTWDAFAGVYKTRDGRFVRLHTNFRHHRDAVCKVLGCEPEREKVQAALMQWDAEAFETAAYAEGGVVAMMRSREEWLSTPHGKALAGQPVVTIEKRSARPRQSLGQELGRKVIARSPGLRVLDLSRVIAGPVAGRTLAAHGADVMLISGPDLPAIPWLTIDTGRGKLTSFADLKSEQGRATLRALLAEADIFSQGYRPRSIAACGFSPEEAARINPGIVYVSLSAYGHQGPWARVARVDRHHRRADAEPRYSRTDQSGEGDGVMIELLAQPDLADAEGIRTPGLRHHVIDDIDCFRVGKQHDSSRHGASNQGLNGLLRSTGDLGVFGAVDELGLGHAGGGLSARSDRTRCDTDPGALTLLICVRVQSFLVHSIGEHGVCGAGVDQSNVTEDADVDIVYSETLEGTGLSDVLEEFVTVPGDARSLNDEVFSEELAKALDIVELVGVDVVIVELLEDHQIFGGLLGVVHFLLLVCAVRR